MHPSVVKEPERFRKRRSPHPASCAQVGRSGIPFGRRTWTLDLTAPGRSLPPARCCPAHTMNRTHLHRVDPTRWVDRRIRRPFHRPPASGGTGTPRHRASALRPGALRAAQPRPRLPGFVLQDEMEIALWRSSSVGSPLIQAGSSIRNAKSRVSVVSRSEHLALLRWSSGELLQRQPSNRGPTGRDSRSSSRQFSKRGRSAQVRAFAWGCYGPDHWTYPTASSGSYEPATLEMIRRVGSAHHLQKPFGDNELFDAMRRAMAAA